MLACAPPSSESVLDSEPELIDETPAGDDAYAGGWPQQPDSDRYAEDAPDWEHASGEPGSQLPRFHYMDQYGDFVDVYDFAGHDRPVVLDVCATWGPACQVLSSYMAGGSDLYGLNGDWPSLPELVDRGDVLFLTVLSENGRGQLPSGEDLADWHATYPNAQVPILGDDGNLADGLDVAEFPSIFLFDENLILQVGPSPGSEYAALDALEAEYSE